MFDDNYIIRLKFFCSDIGIKRILKVNYSRSLNIYIIISNNTMNSRSDIMVLQTTVEIIIGCNDLSTSASDYFAEVIA